jgi:hypothetical protein
VLISTFTLLTIHCDTRRGDTYNEGGELFLLERRKRERHNEEAPIK